MTSSDPEVERHGEEERHGNGAVLVDRGHEPIVVVTMNRPSSLNAMNDDLLAGLHSAFETLGADRSCRVIVLTGAGRGFCSGLDLKEPPHAPGSIDADRSQVGFATQQHIASLVPRMRSMPQPIIAAVNGAASGGGLALALASDIRIASSEARFNVAFVRLGLSGCDIGVSWILPRLIGASRAYELMLTGRIFDAAEADRMGLLTGVTAPDGLLDAALSEAGLIVANSPFGIKMTKEVMWSQLEVGSMTAGIDLENRTQILASTTGDMAEAIAAFMEKRPADFDGS